MPIRKLRLNAAEARQTSSFINQLCAEGVDLGADREILAVVDEVCPLEITQGRDVGVVCEVPPLNVAVAIPICIVARRRVIVKDYYIELPWGSVTCRTCASVMATIALGVYAIQAGKC
jgi:hypothetical protein